MALLLKEFREIVARNCDLSQPLRVISYDTGKKAQKHSTLQFDEGTRVRFKASPGIYDDRVSIEFNYDEEATVLTAKMVLDAVDNLLEDNPRAILTWVYFFYFPIDYKTLFGKVSHADCSLLDTSEIQEIYVLDRDPNTLVIKAAYKLGFFND